jgi:hypothetical protein
MRVQVQIFPPAGVRRACVTVAARKNSTVPEWTARYLRNDWRRYASSTVPRGRD